MKRYIITNTGWREIEATPIKNDMGLDLFCNKRHYGDGIKKWENGDGYAITDGATGLALFHHDAKKECTAETVCSWLALNNVTLAEYKGKQEKAIEIITQKYGPMPEGMKGDTP